MSAKFGTVFLTNPVVRYLDIYTVPYLHKLYIRLLTKQLSTIGCLHNNRIMRSRHNTQCRLQRKVLTHLQGYIVQALVCMFTDEVVIDKMFILTHTFLQNDCTGKLESDGLQDKLVHYVDYSCSFFVL